MTAPRSMIVYLPLVWTGFVGTWMTFGGAARGSFNVHRLSATLHLRSPFTLAMLVYGAWTAIGALLLFLALDRLGVDAADVGVRGQVSQEAFLLSSGGALVAIILWPALEKIKWLDGGTFPSPALDLRSHALGRWDYVLLASVGAVAVPALEEFVFRGYLLASLLAYAGKPTSLIVVSMIFASVHAAFGVGTVLYAFMLSALFCALVLHFGNLYPAIIMHVLVNLFGFVVAPIASFAKSIPQSSDNDL